MKTGRLILTFREDIIPPLKKFYSDGNRTDFLVIAYNWATVSPSKFETSDRFSLVPYHPPKGTPSISGLQYKVWVDVAKQFPDVDTWIIQDYDFYCRPTDAEIFAHVGEKEYGMVGKAFPVWQKGMKDIAVDNYPFPEAHKNWHQPNAGSAIDDEVDAILLKKYGLLYGGYSDFLAVRRSQILLLDNPDFANVRGGLEVMPHTIWKKNGIEAIDMRKFFKMKVLMDVLYLPITQEYDMINPVKNWNTGVDLGARFKNIKMNLKKAVKRMIGYQGWR
jgi:hypothetical protein